MNFTVGARGEGGRLFEASAVEELVEARIGVEAQEEGLDILGGANLGEGVVVAGLFHEDFGEPLVGGGVAGVEGDSGAEFLLGGDCDRITSLQRKGR